jgi:hypothetical protein
MREIKIERLSGAERVVYVKNNSDFQALRLTEILEVLG